MPGVNVLDSVDWITLFVGYHLQVTISIPARAVALVNPFIKPTPHLTLHENDNARDPEGPTRDSRSWSMHSGQHICQKNERNHSSWKALRWSRFGRQDGYSYTAPSFAPINGRSIRLCNCGAWAWRRLETTGIVTLRTLSCGPDRPWTASSAVRRVG